jgi:hypothetical protein
MKRFGRWLADEPWPGAYIPRIGSFALGACMVFAVMIGVAACTAGPDTPAVSGGTPGGEWHYAVGPRGEHCLFFADGTGQYATLAMDCDTVNP